MGEVLAARAEFEAALTQLGLRHWPSQANFVLMEIGAEHRGVCAARCARAAFWCAIARPIPGCDGLCAHHGRHARADAAGAWWLNETSLKEHCEGEEAR